jgi:hypothetical protein
MSGQPNVGCKHKPKCEITHELTNGIETNTATRRYVRFLEPTAAVVGPREAVPGIWLTIAEPVNQVVRPAYAKLDEGCSE